MAEGTTCFL